MEPSMAVYQEAQRYVIDHRIPVWAMGRSPRQDSDIWDDALFDAFIAGTKVSHD